MLGLLFLSRNDNHLWFISGAILYFGWLLRDFCKGFNVLNKILLRLRWNISIVFLLSSFVNWFCLEFLRIYNAFLGDDFKSGSPENRIRG